MFLDLRCKQCLVIGGGERVGSRIEPLVRSGARVRVVAPALSESVAAIVERQGLRYARRGFTDADLDGVALVVADDLGAELNAALRTKTRHRNILLNVVDQPESSSFIFPAVVRRGDLGIAVSTSGRAPALAVRLKERIARLIGPEYESFVALVGQLRQEVRAESFAVRRRRWYRIVDSDVLALLGDGRLDEAETLARRILEGYEEVSP